jgi:DNA-binding beta-propeller fold protein YncE
MLAAPAAAAVVGAPGYAVHTIPTPGMVQGGVLRRGGAILVGQGSFGAGAESIIRLDAGGSTTIATGFNSLGGFDLDAGGTLYVVDNGGNLSGATTGDTLFAIPNALTASSAVAAAGHELAPAGQIPAAQDVLLIPGGAPLVSDARGPGAGKVVKVAGGMVMDFLSPFDYTAGLALAADGTLLVGDVDGTTFEGSISKFALDGTPLGPLVSALSGTYALVVDADGKVLVSGGFTPDFSSSTVIAVAAGGTFTERAHGFSFSTEMFFDPSDDEVLVLDAGASGVAAIGPERVKLKIGKLAIPAGNTLKLKGEMTVPSFLPAPDPVANGVRIRLDGAAGNLLDATIPGGSGWETNKTGTAWTYQNPSGILGIEKVVVKTPAKAPGTIKFLVVGKDGSYPVAPSDLPLRATMMLDPPSGSTGLTSEASFAACGFDGSAHTLRCH